MGTSVSRCSTDHRNRWLLALLPILLVTCGLDRIDSLTGGDPAATLPPIIDDKDDASAKSSADGEQPDAEPISDAGSVEDADASPNSQIDADADAPAPEILEPLGVPEPQFVVEPFQSNCEPGDVVVGVGLRFGWWTDAIGAICATRADEFTSTYDRAPHGGHGGAPTRLVCPIGHAAFGVIGEHGWFFDSAGGRYSGLQNVGVICTDIATKTDSNVQRVSSMQNFFEHAEFSGHCTEGRLLNSITGLLQHGTYGTIMVVRIGGVCEGV